MPIAILKYPLKSHRKSITIPTGSTQLAELIGIIAGDGAIYNTWQVKIYLNSITDLKYSDSVGKLFKKLFALETNIHKRLNENCIVLDCSSSNVVEFLMSKGAVKGNKVKQNIDIPPWIMANTQYRIAFLRGLFDTDGCTYIDHHKYKDRIYGHIGLAFTSSSFNLLESISKILKNLGYSPTISTRLRILLRKEKEVLRFFQEFKPSNPRHYGKLREFLEEYRSGRNGAASKAAVAVRLP